MASLNRGTTSAGRGKAGLGLREYSRYLSGVCSVKLGALTAYDLAFAQHEYLLGGKECTTNSLHTHLQIFHGRSATKVTCKKPVDKVAWVVIDEFSVCSLMIIYVHFTLNVSYINVCVHTYKFLYIRINHRALGSILWMLIHIYPFYHTQTLTYWDKLTWPSTMRH